MKFIRWGGLSSVNHKKAFKEDTFHSPPLKRGIYVFHPKFIETFLISWKLYNKDDSKKYIKKRSFDYNGKIWTHIFHNHSEITYYRRKNGWYETDTDSLNKLFSIEIKSMDKQIKKDYGYSLTYKSVTYDHMELFIERYN